MEQTGVGGPHTDAGERTGQKGIQFQISHGTNCQGVDWSVGVGTTRMNGQIDERKAGAFVLWQQVSLAHKTDRGETGDREEGKLRNRTPRA